MTAPAAHKRKIVETGEQPLVSGRGLTKVYGLGRKETVAVDNVDFDFYRGEIISLVGESGSGKTTLAKMILGLTSLTGGQILISGKDRDISSPRKKKAYWKHIQAIFQDPYSTFNTFNKIDRVLSDCLAVTGKGNLSKAEKEQLYTEACAFVNLRYAELSGKYPFELSGGQMQRLMIARIFLMKPQLLIADEPTSMIDACSRATILDMLMKLRDEVNMTIVFITHDIGLAYYVSDSVYIMEHGKFVERGTADEVILNPREPYTKRLISDVPSLAADWNLKTPEILITSAS